MMKPILYDNTIQGEPEIKFSVDEQNFVHLWIGTFDTLMEYGIPNKEGWDGILLNYHLSNGFYETENWIVPELLAYAQSIENINVPVEAKDTIWVKNCLIQLFQYAIDNRLNVTINYF